MDVMLQPARRMIAKLLEADAAFFFVNIIIWTQSLLIRQIKWSCSRGFTHCSFFVLFLLAWEF
jgi:hypothetical protein